MAGSSKASYSAGVSSPAQVSKSWIADAPAAICDFRYDAVARRNSIEEFAHERGLVTQHLLGARDVAARLTFDHVAGERPRSGGEANHRDVGADGLANSANRVGHESCVALGIEIAQPPDSGNIANRIREHWAGIGYVERQSHRFRDDQNIRENDDGIHIQRAKWLDGNFGRQFRRFTNFKERVPRAHCLIFGQVTSGLAHDPDRDAVDRLEAAGAEEQVPLIFVGARHRIARFLSIIAEGRVHRNVPTEGAGGAVCCR